MLAADKVHAYLHDRATNALVALYLARRIAEAHYGTLIVESPASQGVRVTLGLPVAEQEVGGQICERNGSGGSFQVLA